MFSLCVSSDVTIDQDYKQQWHAVFGVLTLSSTHFLAKTIFSRGYGGVHKTYGNSRGVGLGGYFCVQKMEIPGRREGLVWNSLRGGGMDIFWKYTLMHLFNLRGAAKLSFLQNVLQVMSVKYIRCIYFLFTIMITTHWHVPIRTLEWKVRCAESFKPRLGFGIIEAFYIWYTLFFSFMRCFSWNPFVKTRI